MGRVGFWSGVNVVYAGFCFLVMDMPVMGSVNLGVGLLGLAAAYWFRD